jgi:glutamate-1-semialdehyde 2,1-aminomutase
MADSDSRISESLFERAQKTIPGGVNSPVRAFRSVGGTPFFTKSADGPFLFTADGQRLIDFVCTWGPAIHGHNNPTIRASLEQAIKNGTSFGTPSPSEVDMAERIVAGVPSVEKVRMVNSGTEATMSCIRLARGFTGRDKIVKFAGCYHGHVDSLLISAGSGALTHGSPDSAGIPASFARETVVIDYNDPDALREVFAANPEQIAAVIIEPYPANVGLILPRQGYLQEVRRLCSENGALLIFDEVMTGFRVAYGGVQEKEAVKPDLTAMGKIIGGGLPVGAFGGKADIMNQLAPIGPVYQAGTLSGNPLAMAAGLASLHLLSEHPPYAKLEAVGLRLATAMEEAATEKGIALQVPRTGSMFSFFFSEKPVTNYPAATAANGDLFAKLFHFALERGVYLPPSPFETCFISTAHDEATIDQACEVLCRGIKAL